MLEKLHSLHPILDNGNYYDYHKHVYTHTAKGLLLVSSQLLPTGANVSTSGTVVWNMTVLCQKVWLFML